MTTKQYLNQIQTLTLRIKRLDDEIERNRLMLLPGAIRYDKDRVQTSPKDQMSEYAAKIDALTRRQDKLRQELATKRDRIIRELMSLENVVYEELLYLRYVRLQRYEAIADEMGYTADHVRHMHGWALSEFRKKKGWRQ